MMMTMMVVVVVIGLECKWRLHIQVKCGRYWQDRGGGKKRIILTYLYLHI
jgi:hypothetical protein